MKRKFFLVLVLCSQSYAFAGTHYDDFSGSKSEHFGINYPEILDSGSSTSTQTTHHRWGNQTGIGSSSMQTQSATAGSMPTVNYRPTSVSPALQMSSPGTGMQHLDLFSQRMSSPALSPVLTGSPSLGTNANQSSFQSSMQSTSGLESIGLPGGGRHQSRGGALGRELSDPFKGL